MEVTYQALPKKLWDHQMPNPTSPHGFEWVLGQQRRKKEQAIFTLIIILRCSFTSIYVFT
jgi:hypothetical protein